MVKKEIDESNTTLENDETFKVDVDGIEVDAKIDENGNVVVNELPENVTEEALNKAIEKHKELNTTLAKAKNERFNQNKRTKELDERETKLITDRAEFDKKKLQLKEPPAPTVGVTLLSELGVKNYTEVNDIRDDDPERYYKAQDKVALARIRNQTKDVSSASLKQAQRLVNDSILDKQLQKENINPATVKSYLKAHGALYNEFGIDAFKKVVLKQSNLSEDYRKLEDKPKVIITKKSERRPAKSKKSFKNYSDKEIEDMPTKNPEEWKRLKALEKDADWI